VSLPLVSFRSSGLAVIPPDERTPALPGAALLPFFVQTNSGNLQNRTDVFAVLSKEDGDFSRNNREEVNASPKSARDLVKAHREVRAND
jgi:hypothetical protein